MKKKFTKIIVGNLLFFPMTCAMAAVWHPLNINQELPPDTIVETTIEQELQPQKILARQQINSDDLATHKYTQEQINKEVTPSKVSAAFSIGTITGGQAKESLYLPNEGANISLLTWDIKNSPIIKTELNWNILPWLAFNINGWTTFNDNHSTMNDYDWLNEKNRSEVTDWSYHNNTRLNSANHIDLNLTTWIVEKSDYKLGLTAGYQQDHFSWTTKGGSFKYSDKDNNQNYISDTAQSIQGNFFDYLTVGGYKQNFKTPYIGLLGTYQKGNIALNTGIKYSKWSKVSTEDQHYLRDMTIHTKAKSGQYFSANVNAGYYVMPYTKLFAEINWNQYKRNLGQISVIEDGETAYIDQNIEQSGTQNRYIGINTGLQYEF